MLSILCKVSRHFVINYNACPKTVLRNTLRYNVTVANAIKSQRVNMPKKEPGEIFKWILLVLYLIYLINNNYSKNKTV